MNIFERDIMMLSNHYPKYQRILKPGLQIGSR